MVSTTVFPKRKPGLLGELADPRLGQEVDQIRQASGGSLAGGTHAGILLKQSDNPEAGLYAEPKQHFLKRSRSSNQAETMAQWHKAALPSTEMRWRVGAGELNQ